MRFAMTLVAVSVGLAACGGGSDGDVPSSGPTPVAGQATLTSANYVAVAQEALSSNTYLIDATSLVVGAQVSSDPKVLVRFGQDQLTKAPGWFANTPVQPVGAVYKETQQCKDSGTVTLEVDDRNGNQQVDAGESMSLTVSNCSFEGEVLNGQLTVTFNRLIGDPSKYPFDLSAILQFTNLTARTANESVVGNGSLAMDIQASNVNAQTVKLSTSSFSLSNTNGLTTYSQTLQDHETNLKASPVGSSATWTSSVNGTLISSAFDGNSVRIETPESFVRSGAQYYPSSGSALITGASGAKIRVTTVDTTTVTIDLDADGNGIYETTVNKLWSEMI